MTKAAAILVLLLAAGCEKKPPEPLQLAWEARVAEARADCGRRGGDEFKPYGAGAWTELFLGEKKRPMVFRCLRLLRNWKHGIAVYAMKVEGDSVSMEIR